MASGQLRNPQKGQSYFKFRNLCCCLRSGEPLRVNEMTVDPLDIRCYSASINSSPFEETGRNHDTGNIQEVETSLRESHSLNYEEARAFLGRHKYQKGNIGAALHVFEGIDISSVTQEMRVALSILEESCMRPSQSYESPPLSIHDVGLLFEAMFLKSKCLQALRRYIDEMKTDGTKWYIFSELFLIFLWNSLGRSCSIMLRYSGHC